MIAEFLRKYRPDGIHVLTSIVPDGKISTRSFSDPEEAEAWALSENKTRNVYFSVNVTTGPLNKKATKAEIAQLNFLHVDVDPRAGEDIESERARIRTLLNGSLSDKGIPPPTLVIDSGGGYAAYWRLAEPVLLNGDPAKIAEAERYNIELANRLGGDHCHDVSRIMRLPGLTNWPDKKKRARGREPADAEVYAWPASEPYPLSAFTPAALAAEGTRRGMPKARPALSLTAGTGVGSEALQAWAKEHGKEIEPTALAALVHGRDADPTNYPSRSEPLWHVLRGLIRADVPDEMIVAAVTDDQNIVSACVLDKPNPIQEAWRQLEKAHAEEDRERRTTAEREDKDLSDMNRRYAVIEAGRVRVQSWRRTHPKIDRLAVDLQSFEDFRNRHRHEKVVIGYNEKNQPVMKAKGAWWLDHERRRQIKGICFEPGEPAEIEGFQNLWRGWAVEPKQGDWSLMREHVRAILAQGNDEHADYIIRWAAWAVQNPGKQAEVALVFRGGRGTGKSMFGRALKDLFGQHGLHIRSTKHVTGDFNLHLRDCCLLFADEAIAPGDKAAESRLKGLITEPENLIEGKGENAVMETNHLHVVMASNEGWVVPAGKDERRFAAFDVSDARKQDLAYFGAVVAEREAGGLAAMLYDFLEMDLGNWHPRDLVPQTDALMSQKIQSLDGFEAFMFDVLSTGDFYMKYRPYSDVQPDQECSFVSTEAMRSSAAAFLRARHGIQHVNGKEVVELMRDLGCVPHRRGNGGARGFLLPTLATMRTRWNAMKFVWKWPFDDAPASSNGQNESEQAGLEYGDNEQEPQSGADKPPF